MNQNGRLSISYAGVVSTPNAQLRERKVEVEFKTPFQLLHKTRLQFGVRVSENSEHPFWLTTYAEIRTYYIQNLKEAE
ncbi:MAG: hypothetical protein HYV33_06510 [Candidatus Kerfeldbacteria bacterium]|nr:hypothetical protein [Candidatus Kerfeldbacteria bacterium]